MRKPAAALLAVALSTVATAGLVESAHAAGSTVAVSAITDKKNDVKNANIDLTQVTYLGSVDENTFEVSFSVKDLTSTDGTYTATVTKGGFVYKVYNDGATTVVTSSGFGSVSEAGDAVAFDLDADTVTLKAPLDLFGEVGKMRVKGTAKQGKQVDQTKVGSAILPA